MSIYGIVLLVHRTQRNTAAFAELIQTHIRCVVHVRTAHNRIE